MCIGTCTGCMGDIDVDDGITVFPWLGFIFHDECCPVDREYIEAFGGVKKTAEESMHPFYREGVKR